MRKSIINYLGVLDVNKFTNNHQHVLYALLRAASVGDGWVALDSFSVNSSGSRIRDLRKQKYGQFDIHCRKASELKRDGDQYTFFYKVAQKDLTVSKLKSVFKQ